MKNLLILLSFLLLSSPLFSQSKETGVLFQYKTSSGFVWKTFGKGEVQPKYKGEISNGTPEGLGVLSYPFTDGKRVEGEWKDGKEWNTEHYKKDGKVIGKWVNGKWILKWGVLCGTLEEGKQHGQGTITFPDGNKGVGEFRGNKSWNITTYDKDGNIIWMMLNGVKVEKKILFRDTPRSKWVKGGEKWFRSGDEKRQAKYEGEILTGVPNGWGTITFPSGSNYVGGFKDGKRTGQGTMSFFDGGKYKGKWKDGRKNGQGTETYSSGRKYEGEWKNNKPWEGTLYDRNEKNIGRIVNGEQQK